MGVRRLDRNVVDINDVVGHDNGVGKQTQILELSIFLLLLPFSGFRLSLITVDYCFCTNHALSNLFTVSALSVYQLATFYAVVYLSNGNELISLFKDITTTQHTVTQTYVDLGSTQYTLYT